MFFQSLLYGVGTVLLCFGLYIVLAAPLEYAGLYNPSTYISDREEHLSTQYYLTFMSFILWMVIGIAIGLTLLGSLVRVLVQLV